jgi:hypothetical protein
MGSQQTRIVLHISAGPEADAEEQADLTERLQRELADLDVEAVERVRVGMAPAGAKGDPLTLATLAVTLAPVALKSMTDLLQSWLSRHERASVILESGGAKITLTGTPSLDQIRIAEAWVERLKA